VGNDSKELIVNNEILICKLLLLATLVHQQHVENNKLDDFHDVRRCLVIAAGFDNKLNERWSFRQCLICLLIRLVAALNMFLRQVADIIAAPALQRGPQWCEW